MRLRMEKTLNLGGLFCFFNFSADLSQMLALGKCSLIYFMHTNSNIHNSFDVQV